MFILAVPAHGAGRRSMGDGFSSSPVLASALSTQRRMDIQDLLIFARVAAVQNLSAVGAELGLTPGTISKRIQALEDELSVRLFERTTRHIRITEEGATFFQHVERILDEIEHARASVGDKVRSPKGRVKITAPVLIGRRVLAPAAIQFLREYPDIELQVDLTDRIVNLQEEGYDLGIRVGILSDSSLVARRILTDNYVVVGSPSYLEAHGLPLKPSDLSSHQCLMTGDMLAWSFRADDDIDTVRVAGRLRSWDGEMLHTAALAGEGLMRAMSCSVADDIAAGRLVRVLQDFEVKANSAVWAVYPSSKYLLPKIRVLLDFLHEYCKNKQTT